MRKWEINKNLNDPLHSFIQSLWLGYIICNYNLQLDESSVLYKPNKVSYVKSYKELIGTYAIQ